MNELSNSADRADIDRLIQTMNDKTKSDKAREDAADELGRIASEESIAALIRNLLSSERMIQSEYEYNFASHIIISLVKAGDNALKPLIEYYRELARSKLITGRSEAIETIKRIIENTGSYEKVKEIIVEILALEDSFIVRSSLDILERHIDAEMTVSLLKLIKRSKDLDICLKAAIILTKLGNFEGFKAIAQRDDFNKMRSRLTLRSYYPKTADTLITETIVAIINDKNISSEQIENARFILNYLGLRES